jgi:lysozyme family protein
MNDHFEMAFDFVMKNEGELNENPNDSGGISNRGISLRFLREVKETNLRRYGIFGTVTEDTIRELTLDQIKLIYRGEFWDGSQLDEIEDSGVRAYIFDMVVNHGISQAIRMVQRGLWAVLYDREILRCDGIIGFKTIGYLNSIAGEILPIIIAIRGEFYRSWVMNSPKDTEFLEGWLNRCYRMP